jgi:hypothetical protein
VRELGIQAKTMDEHASKFRKRYAVIQAIPWGVMGGQASSGRIAIMSDNSRRTRAYEGLSKQLVISCGSSCKSYSPPNLFGEAGEFRQRVSEFARELRATRPLDPAQPVRVPFERSAAERQRRLAAGVIEVQEVVVRTLRDACAVAV